MLSQLTGPLRELHRILDEFSECVILAQDYFQMVDIPRDFSYAPALSEVVPSGNDIDIRKVSFAYPEKPQERILTEVSLQVASGKFIGIAGPSGCGKSTLIKLVDKLEQAQGDVYLGSAELGGLSRRALAEVVALVSQTPFLIADTVYRNICYGMTREVSLEEVKEAARKASIAADIEKLPGGYQFILSEGGTNLSSGQRLTTLRNCDEIIVMDHGEIVQRGTYAQLESTPGLFRDMALGILK